MNAEVSYLGEEGKLPILVVFEPPLQDWIGDENITVHTAILYDAAAPMDDDNPCECLGCEWNDGDQS